MTTIQGNLRQALYDAVSGLSLSNPIGVAFSGGVDSSLLAKICVDLSANLTLLTVGFPGSADIIFSKRIANLMGISHKASEIRENEFPNDFDQVTKSMSCKNTSHLENCIAYWYIARLAAQNGIKTVVSANGCDELFCGYNAYREVFPLGEKAILDLMDTKLDNEMELVQEIKSVASQIGIHVEQPFLSPLFVTYARTIPISEKISGSNDLIRKHILRKVAVEIGVPSEAATKPKKALQYGSLLHKHFKKHQRDLSRLRTTAFE